MTNEESIKSAVILGIVHWKFYVFRKKPVFKPIPPITILTKIYCTLGWLSKKPVYLPKLYSHLSVIFGMKALSTIKQAFLF